MAQNININKLRCNLIDSIAKTIVDDTDWWNIGNNPAILDESNETLVFSESLINKINGIITENNGINKDIPSQSILGNKSNQQNIPGTEWFGQKVDLQTYFSQMLSLYNSQLTSLQVTNTDGSKNIELFVNIFHIFQLLKPFILESVIFPDNFFNPTPQPRRTPKLTGKPPPRRTTTPRTGKPPPRRTPPRRTPPRRTTPRRTTPRRTTPRRTTQPPRVSIELEHHYETLGVPLNANKKTLTKAFHKKARKYHPDKYEYNPVKTPGENIEAKLDAEEKFKKMKDSYDNILSELEQKLKGGKKIKSRIKTKRNKIQNKRKTKRKQ